MIDLRFVLSEDKQVISRVGLFNLNFEYHVFNPWIEKLAAVFAPSLPSASTSQITVTDGNPVSLPSRLPPPAQFNMSLSDCTIALNPLDHPSRGLFLISSTTVRGQWDFQDGGRGKFDVSINRAHLFCIDEATNLLSQPRQRFRSSGRKEIVSHFSVLMF
jgi:Autophagy-related protein 2 CAD motif